MAMTCCEADMTFIGYICKAREAKNLETKTVGSRKKPKVAYEYWKDYGDKGPVLYAEKRGAGRRKSKGYVQF